MAKKIEYALFVVVLVLAPSLAKASAEQATQQAKNAVDKAAERWEDSNKERRRSSAAIAKAMEDPNATFESVREYLSIYVDAQYAEMTAGGKVLSALSDFEGVIAKNWMDLTPRQIDSLQEWESKRVKNIRKNSPETDEEKLIVKEAFEFLKRKLPMSTLSQPLPPPS